MLLLSGQALAGQYVEPDRVLNDVLSGYVIRIDVVDQRINRKAEVSVTYKQEGEEKEVEVLYWTQSGSNVILWLKEQPPQKTAVKMKIVEPD